MDSVSFAKLYSQENSFLQVQISPYTQRASSAVISHPFFVICLSECAAFSELGKVWWLPWFSGVPATQSMFLILPLESKAALHLHTLSTPDAGPCPLPLCQEYLFCLNYPTPDFSVTLGLQTFVNLSFFFKLSFLSLWYHPCVLPKILPPHFEEKCTKLARKSDLP